MTYSPENWHERFTRFVMLRASDTPYPGMIRTSLQEYWGEMVEVHNPISAFEELCLLYRREEPRRRNSDPTRERIALVVIESGSWEHLQELFRVIRDKLPEIEIFVVDEVEGATMLMNVTNSRPDAIAPPAADPPPSPMNADSVTDPAPFLRYTGEPEQHPESEESLKEAQPPETAPEASMDAESSDDAFPEDPPDRTLTPEELDALLGRSDDHEDDHEE